MTQANITYLFHSGYSVETATRFLVFDYYQPSENLQFLTSRSFQTTPPAWVFASHSHGDHFDPVIFSWDSPENPITYVLSDDVFPKRIPPGHRCHVLKEGESLSQDGLVITAYGSSDLGLSFLVEADGLRLFHAGDLNWWHWKGETAVEQAYAKDLFHEKMAALRGHQIDIAFFPVDRRLEEFHSLGAETFAKEIKPTWLLPMHFGKDVEASRLFAAKAAELGIKTKVIEHANQRFEITL